MPDDLLNLNLGQVQAVIEGYSERITDDTIQSIWTGYYASYFFSKNHKKPTEVIERLLQSRSQHLATKNRHNVHDIDIDAEIELMAKRDLAFFMTKGGENK